MNFLEIYDKYLSYMEIKAKPQSLRSIKSKFNLYILPYFKDKNINDITTFEYLEWQKTIEGKGFSYKYNKSLHYSCVALFNFSISFLDLEIKNIPSKVGCFKNKYDIIKNVDFWTPNEYFNFIKNVDNYIDKVTFEFLYFTGCRIGELEALTFNDLIDNIININKTISKEFYNGKRVITTPKTKTSIRKILIDDYLLKEINKLKEYYKNKYNNFNNNFYIFGGNKPLSNTTIERKKNKYCDKANVKRIRIHDFRHSHVYLLMNNNIPITAISKRLGHANTSITLDVYSHFSNEDEIYYLI